MKHTFPRPSPDSLTYKRLRELLHYNPATGMFTWLVDRGNKCPAGSVAGGLRPDGYLVIGIDYGIHRASRLAWLYITGDMPKDEIDHKNCVRDDNRWSNLRLATRTQQRQNTSVKKHTCDLKGVGWHKHTQKWRAYIIVNGRYIHLGLHDTPEEAHTAYVRAAKFYFGEFARAG